MPSKMNDEAIARLRALYLVSQKALYDHFDSVSDFSRANRLALLSQVQGELKKLGIHVQLWIDQEIPQAYSRGMKDSVDGLKHLIDKEVMARDQLSVKTLFTQPNKLQVQALIDDTSKSFGESMTLIGRNVRSITGQAFQREVRAKLAEGVVTAQTRKEIIASVKQELRDRGLVALRDRSGAEWTLDRYADMLARTTLTEARNTGLSTKMLENGNDLVQVSINGSDHPACADWEGQILSLSGNSPQYDTVDDAEAAGLFHPNCQHTINAIEPDLAKETYGWDSESGKYEQGIINE